MNGSNMDLSSLSITEWKSGFDTPHPSYVPYTALSEARDQLLTHPNTRARAEAGMLSTEETIYYAQCLLEPLPPLNFYPGTGRRQPVRNSFQWAGPLERHIQAVALNRTKRVHALVRTMRADLNLERKHLSQTIMSARRARLMLRQDRDVAAGRLGPAYSINSDLDLIWKELLRQGVW